MPIDVNLLQFIFVVLTSVIGGGVTLWNLMSGKIDKAVAALTQRVESIEKKAENHLDRETFNDVMGGLKQRLDHADIQRDKFITRDEFAEGQRRLEGMISALAQNQAAATATITGRIDAVLFQTRSGSNDR